VVTAEIFKLLLVGVAAGLAGCASDGTSGAAPPPATDGATIACDPLAPKPITLGTVVGVGTDADGTSYVDAANGVFVSSGAELVRQHVTGTGQSGATEYLFRFEPPNEPAAARTLLVETDDSGSARQMALGAPDSRQFLDQNAAGITPLTLVDAASVSGLALVNTPNEISYVGDVEDGTVVFATVPMNRDEASQSGGLSIFYGAPDAVEERQITDFQQSLSNNGTVTFLVGAESYVLAFGTVTRGDSPLGDFTLESLTPGTGAPLAVTLRSPTPRELPPELSFSCLR
jgi:hypothetical protein